jgi:hypothetical protein
MYKKGIGVGVGSKAETDVGRCEKKIVKENNEIINKNSFFRICLVNQNKIILSIGSM